MKLTELSSEDQAAIARGIDTESRLRAALEAWEKWAEGWSRVIDGTMFYDSPFLIEYRSARAKGRKALGKE